MRSSPTSAPGRFARLLANDRPAWLLALLARRLWYKLRSLWLQQMLHAPGAHFAGHLNVRGTRHIHFGAELYVNGSAWIEAIAHHEGEAFQPSLLLGDRVAMSDRVHISCASRIQLGNDVLIGSNVFISDHSHGSYRGDEQSVPDEPPAARKLAIGGTVSIEDNVWIGDNVVILGPANIGRGAIIGANSVVCGDIPPATMAAGAPARPIKKYSQEKKSWLRI